MAVRCDLVLVILDSLLCAQFFFPFQEAIDSVKDTLVEFFTSGEGSKAPPTSLYFQLQGRKWA